MISSLDDDDMPMQDKLETIYNIFKEEKISEIHNDV